MKFLLLATFVIACTASALYRNRNISVNDDGSILITSPYGKRISILRQFGLDGERNIDITISGPNIPTKTIQVGDSVYGEVPSGGSPWSSVDSLGEELRLKRGSTKGKSQGDILTEVLKEYQGVVDEAQYEKLLNRINKAVKKGEISPQIYDLLQGLDQQGTYGQSVPYGQGQEEIQGQRFQDEGLIQRQGLYGYGSRYGLDRGYYGYGGPAVLPWWYPRSYQGQYQQYPVLGYYGSNLYNLGRGQYYGDSLNVNPLLERILSGSQGSYINDLLAKQQLLNGGVLSRLGNQIVYSGVPQRILSSSLGVNQQYPYGQIQRVPVVNRIGQQIPQSLQQQQQLEQVQQINGIQGQQQVLEQLNELQQQQQVGQQYDLQRGVSQLSRVPQQLTSQQVGQYRSIPLSLRQPVGQSYYYNQPIYRGFISRQPYTVQSDIPYLNTVPQVQLVY